MNNRREYLPVNWMQGMSVSSSHFIATENSILEHLLGTASILQQPFQYGLLPQKDGRGVVELKITGHGEYTKLHLLSYAGITPGGYLILIEEKEQGEGISCACSMNGDSLEEEWNIVLSVSPYDRLPSGIPDVQEMPPRYPYVEPSYKLSLHSRNLNNHENYDAFCVIVGVLKKIDANYILDGNYIPPALSMSSLPELHRYASDFNRRIKTIDNALHKIVEQALEQSNRTSIANSVLLLCKELMRTTSSLFFHWRNAYTMSPYHIVVSLVNLASTVQCGLKFLSKREKEEMLKYFHEWNGVTPSTFEQLLDEVTNKPYNHNRINESMISVSGAIGTLEELLVSLSRLEFIGQHKESIVISERQIQDTSSSGRDWTLID